MMAIRWFGKISYLAFSFMQDKDGTYIYLQ
jgi:hypothetical protein